MDPLEKVKGLEQKAKLRIPERRKLIEAPVGPAKVVKLPFWSELERAIPNIIARSALFAPIARGQRKIHDKSVIPSRNDVTITYSGKQLDMADCDVFMQALELAKTVPLGQEIAINRAGFLRSIGRENGKSDYVWLDGAMERLTFGMLVIEAKRYKAAFHLINSWELDKETGIYKLSIAPKIILLFSNREFSLVDWRKRLAISKRVDLAKWMQDYITSHEHGQHHISLSLLKEWSGYTGRLRDFKVAMQEALKELKRVKIIASCQIRHRDDMVIYTRPYHRDSIAPPSG